MKRLRMEDHDGEAQNAGAQDEKAQNDSSS